MSSDTAALRALAEVTTPEEPWPRREIDREGTCDGCAEYKPLVAAYDDPSGDNEPWLCAPCSIDADFTTAARNALPDLLDRVEAAEAERDEWKSLYEAEKGECSDWWNRTQNLRAGIESLLDRGPYVPQDDGTYVSLEDAIRALLEADQ
jgi:hypothetical protein